MFFVVLEFESQKSFVVCHFLSPFVLGSYFVAGWMYFCSSILIRQIWIKFYLIYLETWSFQRNYISSRTAVRTVIIESYAGFRLFSQIEFRAQDVLLGIFILVIVLPSPFNYGMYVFRICIHGKPVLPATVKKWLFLLSGLSIIAKFGVLFPPELRQPCNFFIAQVTLRRYYRSFYHLHTS